MMNKLLDQYKKKAVMKLLKKSNYIVSLRILILNHFNS